MSTERAYVNCKRCHGIAGTYSGSDIDKRRLEDDQLYAARNEAMKAIEDSIKTCDFYLINQERLVAGTVPSESKEKQAEHRVDLVNLLGACKGCDYKNPLIVEARDKK